MRLLSNEELNITNGGMEVTIAHITSPTVNLPIRLFSVPGPAANFYKEENIMSRRRSMLIIQGRRVASSMPLLTDLRHWERLMVV